MRTVSIALALVACGGVAEPAPRQVARQVPARAEEAPCFVVGDEATAEGTLDRDGDAFVLRLDRPRCVEGLRGANVLVEVGVVSTGFDLRPLVGQRIRASGAALPATSPLGGPTVVLLVRQAERP